jgi:putative transposase
LDYGQELNDARVLASVGTVGDAYDNVLAESFVDSFKTELIRDRVWLSQSQLELAVVEYVAWFNNARLHSSLGYRTPAEIEAAWRSGASQPNTFTGSDVLSTLAVSGVYDPSGVVSEPR